MTEELYMTSYADGTKLKKLTVSDLTKSQRALIISHPTSSQKALKYFLSKFYPEYYAQHCTVSIIFISIRN